MRDIRVSPDGDSVAIRSDYPVDSPLAWGVFHALNGGHWVADEASDPNTAIKDWAPLPVPEPVPEAAEPG